MSRTFITLMISLMVAACGTVTETRTVRSADGTTATIETKRSGWIAASHGGGYYGGAYYAPGSHLTVGGLERYTVPVLKPHRDARGNAVLVPTCPYNKPPLSNGLCK